MGRLLEAARAALQAARRALHARAASATAARSSAGCSRRCSIAGSSRCSSAPARELIVEDGSRRRARAPSSDGKELLDRRARRASSSRAAASSGTRSSCAQFLGGQLTHPNSPPVATRATACKMAMALGADLGNMSEAWWCPSVVIPGEEYDGEPLNRGDFAIRSLPHSIIVNRRGARFVNEAHNYNDLMKPFFAFDPVALRAARTCPAWLVLRSAVPRALRAAHAACPGMPVPEWHPARRHARRARGARSASTRAGSRRPSRASTASRVEGVDPDFRPRREPLRSLLRRSRAHAEPQPGHDREAPVLRAPGPPRRDRHQGRRARRRATRRCCASTARRSPGLYAAGNVMAGVTGAGLPRRRAHHRHGDDVRLPRRARTPRAT